MSFASETKKELTNLEVKRCCLRAELSALLRMNGSLAFSGGRMAVEHLLEGGHRRIAFIGGSPQSSVWKARRSGYSEAYPRFWSRAR